MAEFTFGDHREAGSARDETGGTDSGKPGSNSGEASVANGNNGTASGTGNPEGAEAAPFGFTKDGRVRKRRAGGGRRAGSTNRTADEGGEERLAVKNDRAKVRANIAGLHAMAAVLTKQPILVLSDKEADALTTAVCDVADYHGMNLITAGGAFGLYAALATTGYMVYVPKFLQIKYNKAAEKAKPANPGETGKEQQSQAGTMDFSADVMH